MNRFYLFLLFTFLSSTNLFSEGIEPTGNPRQVSSLDHLLWISTNPSSWGDDFIQTADIDATSTNTWNGGEGFLAIGNGSDRFTGNYDGQNHTIDGLYMFNVSSTPGLLENYQGFLGYLDNATIQNLGITNIDVTGGGAVSAVAGYSDNGSIINNCFSSGIVKGSDGVGGLVGINFSSNLSDSYSTCVVYSFENAGGLVGRNSLFSIIQYSYSTGVVFGGDGVGGLTGKNQFDSEIYNSYSHSSIEGNSYLGGLVGYNDDSNINNSYSTGQITGSGSDLGGLIGYSSSGSIINCFWDIDTSLKTTSAGGTGKTTSEMQNVATFTSLATVGLDNPWDFVGNPFDDTANEDIWEIGDIRGYPYLNWEDGIDPPVPVTLSSFTAAYSNGTSILHWTTATETGNLGWNIYRSLSDILEESLQINSQLIPGSGTTSEPTEYSYEDPDELIQNSEYWYWLESMDVSGQTYTYGPISLVIPEDGEDPEVPEIPVPYGLHQNYPNPFNPETNISFLMKEDCTGELNIFNVKGQKIRTLFYDLEIPGEEVINVTWDGRDDLGMEVKTGIYFYKLRTDQESFVRKMMLLK